MKKYISILSLCLVVLFSVFFITGCGKNEIESKWSNTGAWSEIYVYEGEGEFISMRWEGDTGTATFKNTDPSYTRSYANKYLADPNYKKASTGLPDSYSGNVASFITLDEKLWVRIMWTNTSTFLLVKTY